MRHDPRRPSPSCGRQLASLLLLAASACTNEGLDPIPEELNFPIAIELVDPAGTGRPTHLVVANTNFDLRYNGATLQSYDLSKLEAGIAACRLWAGSNPDAAERSVCSVLDPDAPSAGRDVAGVHKEPQIDLLVDTVTIGSFTEAVSATADGRRLYLAVRSDDDLAHVDIGTDGTLACGQSSSRRCAPEFRFTNQQPAEDRDIELPASAVGLHAGPLSDFDRPEAGQYVTMVHRDGSASFFLHRAEDVQPRLVSVLRGMPTPIVSVTYEPTSKTFFVASSASSSLPRFGVGMDAETPDPTLAPLYRTASYGVAGLDVGTRGVANLREIAFDPRGGAHEGRAYIVARTPPSLVLARVDPTRANVRIDHVVDVAPGASRVKLVELPGPLGAPPRVIAFVACYDGREIAIIDVDLGVAFASVRNLSGPFEMEVDLSAADDERLYVIDFRTSVIHVLDLAPTVDCALQQNMTDMTGCSPQRIGMLGIPNAIQELR